MIDVDQLDDTALLALAFELQRDITGGIEVSAGGRPIADVFEEVEAEMSRRQQRSEFKRLPLDALIDLQANVTSSRRSGAPKTAGHGPGPTLGGDYCSGGVQSSAYWPVSKRNVTSPGTSPDPSQTATQ